jgi:hypothetical protein
VIAIKEATHCESLWGARPRRRVRKSVHFFMGCTSGLPSELGVVQETNALSALSRIASLKPSTPVGTHFTERIGIASRHEELMVHCVILRR